jgi:mono/diheme cytochrome c family protein
MTMKLSRTGLSVCLLAWLAILAGCSRSAPPQFKLNYEGKRLSDVKPEARQKLVDSVTALFGTPDEPYIFDEAKEVLNLDKIKLAAGPFGGSHDGTQKGLYRQHCVHCHGISGDGAGPTALFLNPYPRDYRKGVYKFKATERAMKPTDEDLAAVLRNGIPGTAMPAFNLLPSDEIEALVEYVKYLSIRGETESLVAGVIEEDEKITRDVLVEQMSAPLGMWAASKGTSVAPAPYPDTLDKKFDVAAWKADKLDEFYKDAFALASKKDEKAWHALGEAVFKGPRAQCMKCHGPTGLGDGSVDDPLFDDWNKPKADERKRRMANKDSTGEMPFFALPEQIAQPRNLRLGIYRGGRSPADLYRRVHAGVNGSPMPEGKTTLKPLEIWSVVDYVRSLPFELTTKHARPTTNASVHKDRM